MWEMQGWFWLMGSFTSATSLLLLRAKGSSNNSLKDPTNRCIDPTDCPCLSESLPEEESEREREREREAKECMSHSSLPSHYSSWFKWPDCVFLSVCITGSALCALNIASLLYGCEWRRTLPPLAYYPGVVSRILCLCKSIGRTEEWRVTTHTTHDSLTDQLAA